MVLPIGVKFPFARRWWALPILVALDRSKEWDQKHGGRHKTRWERMRQWLVVLIRLFPEPEFGFTGDSGYRTRELARFAAVGPSPFVGRAALHHPAMPIRFIFITSLEQEG